jgi:hypothetical protein
MVLRYEQDLGLELVLRLKPPSLKKHLVTEMMN